MPVSGIGVALAVFILSAMQTTPHKPKFKMKQTDNSKNETASCMVEILFKDDGQYYFIVLDSTNEPLLFSKGFKSDAQCIESAQQLMSMEPRARIAEIKQTKNGSHYFILKSQNKKEIGRSPIFDSLDTLKAKLKRLQTLSPSTVLTLPDSSKPATSETAPFDLTSPQNIVQPIPKMQTPEPEKRENTDQMLRYKFSIIYYPDSDIWNLKHDFTSVTEQLKSCDGLQIERFLKAQLPAQAAKTEPVQPEAKPRPSMDIEVLELQLFDNKGQPLGLSVHASSLNLLKISVKSNKTPLRGTYNAHVTIKSVNHPEKHVLSTSYAFIPHDDSLLISVSGLPNLVASPYIITAFISQIDPDFPPLNYYASQLIVVR